MTGALLADLGTRLRRFHADEGGNGTIEFVIIVPVFIVIFLSTFELGMLMTRHVMLDRGLDMAVRAVRLGAIDPLTHETFKDAICDGAAIIPDCANQLKLEMRPLNPRNWGIIPDSLDCVDRDDPSIAARTFVTGVSNQLMILRACALFNPYFPTTGLGASLPRQSGGAYALVSVSSFVIEPTGAGNN
ncbi:MAG: pilus assembly protein [Rhodobacterales bacterium]|nr:pilus assembly protein [Rhodobacterales bacterium]NCT13375.1 pilus assembly protein [Rhodobacterales bacterium]